VVSPERYAHFHFHVPIWRATVVDVAAAGQTAPQTLERLSLLAKKIGQTPIVQTVENSGYIFNAMLKNVLKSALELLDRGVSDPQGIDLAWTKATGMPVGPFGIMDQIGLDIILQTMSNARFVEGDQIWAPLIARIEPLVQAGHLGVKTGQGFFPYPMVDGGPRTSG
jgi:3-hydroxybutyryl-CoA dehydrogenase